MAGLGEEPGVAGPLIFKPNMSFKSVTRGKKESFITRTNAVLFDTLISISDVIMSIAMSSLLAEVSHDEAKMRERRETSAGFRRVFYHACACVSLSTSDVFVTCDTTHRTGLRAKLQEMSPQSRKFEESEDVR